MIAKIINANGGNFGSRIIDMWNYEYILGKPESKFNVLTAEIILKHCDFDKLNHSLELGAGTGQLSKLLKDKIKDLQTTMVDSSMSACGYIEKYFRDCDYTCNAIQSDIFDFVERYMNYKWKYGIVLSSGLIEHFKDKGQSYLCNIHKKYSRKYIVCIVPFANEENMKFAQSEYCRNNYGYEKPMTEQELDALFVDDKFKKIHSERFYKKDKLLIGIYQRENSECQKKL